MAAKKKVDRPDFSEPWLFSDVVLVVEKQKFHVHRFTLALWSPVFKTMFTSDFQEKNLHEIPLPGKKASEIKELLLLIYPTTSGKALNTINDKNCYSLIKLAHEYQMEVIFKRCEDFLINKVSNQLGNGLIGDLIFAQTYNFEKLLKITIDKASQLRLDDLKSHEMYERIEPQIYKQITEGIIERLENRSCGRCGYRVY